MTRFAARVLAGLLVLLSAHSGTAQPVLSLHETGPTVASTLQTVPRLGGGAPVAVGPSRLDVEPEDLLTIGLQEENGASTLSLWLDDSAAATYATLTEEVAGRDLAVVVDGRAIAIQAVPGPVNNGNLVIAGLPPADAEAVAARLRGASGDAPDPAGYRAESPPVEPEPLPPSERLPISPLDLPGASSGGSASATEPAVRPEVASERERIPDPAQSPGATTEGADAAAVAFVEAVRRRDWRAVVGALHPDAVARLRPDALALLRLDRQTVRIEEGDQSGRLDVPAVLGHRIRGALDELSDEDLGVLYLAALDEVGVWGNPGPPRRAIGRVASGPDRVHVVLESGTSGGGASELSVVTLRRDASGEWRPLLTHARGF